MVMDDLAGSKLGKYKLLEKIGRGGMATVYRGMQLGTQDDVAVKIISPRLASHPRFLDHFRRESLAMLNLKHPHILPVIDVEFEGRTPYIVTKFVAGGSLSRVIAAHSNGLPLKRVITITRQIAGALDYAHDAGIIHRDLKPGNVLMGEDEHVYLCDFGLAEIHGSRSNGLFPGTYAYMAPELVFLQPASPASDIYSLGVMLYEMITGHRPYDLRSREQTKTFWERPPSIPDLRRWRPRLSQGVHVAVAQAMNPDPAGRPPSASLITETLQQALEASGYALSGSEPVDRIFDEAALSTGPHMSITVLDDEPDTDPVLVADSKEIKSLPFSVRLLDEEPPETLPMAALQVQSVTQPEPATSPSLSTTVPEASGTPAPAFSPEFLASLENTPAPDSKSRNTSSLWRRQHVLMLDLMILSLFIIAMLGLAIVVIMLGWPPF